MLEDMKSVVFKKLLTRHRIEAARAVRSPFAVTSALERAQPAENGNANANQVDIVSGQAINESV